VAASAAFSALPLYGLKAKDKVYKTALIGSGWWGMNILKTAIAAGRSKVTALCDVDQRQFQSAAQEVEALTGRKPKVYEDFRDMLKREKPEIVIVGTPDHWHALNTIEALKAGAHVYVEKPISHTINEGKAMVKVAAETGKVVQVGLHRHISPHNVEGMKFLKSGKVGDIGMVRSFVHYHHYQRQDKPNSEPPAGLNWDLWCGPAPLVPYNERIHPKGFRHYLEFANGQAGDWGVHWFDQILWWTEEKAPKKVFSTGGRAVRNDHTNAPDHQVITFDFEGFTATWEHRQFGGNESEKHPLGVYFYGSEGLFHMGWKDGWTFYPKDKKKEVIHMDHQLREPDGQNIPELWADFINAIETNSLPVANLDNGYRATNMSLLGMLSLKLGRSVEWDHDKGIILNDPEANQLLEREYRGEWQYPKS